MKKTIAITIIFTLILTSITLIAESSTFENSFAQDIVNTFNTLTNKTDEYFKEVIGKFKDMGNHWSDVTVGKLVDYGVIDGYEDGTFKPNNKVTRAEFSKMVYTSAKLDKIEGNSFVDTSNHWSKDYINTLVETGGIDKSEYGDNYNPNKNITRLEMAKMVVRTWGLEDKAKEKAGTKTKFDDDSDIPNTDKGYIIIASDNEIINGYPDNTFRPDGEATRAEASTIIVNALDYITKKEKVEDAMTEEGYIDTDKLEKETFEEKGLTEDIRDQLTSINRVTKEPSYIPDEIIEIDKSMLPVVYEGLVIEDYYYIEYENTVLTGTYSIHWALGNPMDMFVIEGKTTKAIDCRDYSTAYLDDKNQIVEGREKLHNVLPTYKFSTDDATKKVIQEFPNIPDENREVQANNNFTFVFARDTETIEMAEKATLRYKGNDTGDVLIFDINR